KTFVVKQPNIFVWCRWCVLDLTTCRGQCIDQEDFTESRVARLPEMYPTIEGCRWPRDVARNNATKFENDSAGLNKIASNTNPQEVIALSAESVADSLEPSTKDTDEKKENAHNTHVLTSNESQAVGDQSKREKEAIVGGLVRVIGQMMNRRQLIMSIISTIFGLYCIYLSEYRDLDDLKYTNIHVNASTLMSIMLVY
uniref:Uncharacterized protein n=1 Tax=Parascaris univalens TaxID=6257 RepID=A0A915CA81_PARUN